jgi:hypothetical protein
MENSPARIIEVVDLTRTGYPARSTLTFSGRAGLSDAPVIARFVRLANIPPGGGAQLMFQMVHRSLNRQRVEL